MMGATIIVVSTYYFIANGMRAVPMLDETLGGVLATAIPMVLAGFLGAIWFRRTQAHQMTAGEIFICTFVSCIIIILVPTVVGYSIDVVMRFASGMGAKAFVPTPSAAQVIAGLLAAPIFLAIAFLPILFGLTLGNWLTSRTMQR